MRILEISNEEGAAAYAGKLFHRWGAEVVRIEAPDRSEVVEALDVYLNGGKRRATIDYATPEGHAALNTLATTCDALVTDLPAQDVSIYRLLEIGDSYEPFVRTSITPFGLSGPYSGFKATEASLLALAGLTYLSGDPGREPLTIPGHYAAYQSGTMAYTAIVAGVLDALRNPGQEPRLVEVSMLECLVGLHQMTDTRWILNKEVRGRLGNRSSASTGAMLPCQDGWFGFSTAGDSWLQFALMLGRQDLINDERFSTNLGRQENRDEFDALVQEALSDRRKRDIFIEGQETWRVPIGYGATLSDCLADRHLEARGFWRPLENRNNSEVRTMKTPGSPSRFMGEGLPQECPPVPTGNDTAEILAELESSTPPSQHGRTPKTLDAPSQPLKGIRILDLTRVWAGPLAARILADLGAEVISVEAPTSRGPAVVPPGTPTYFEGGQRPEPWNHQPLFQKLHRNRTSVSIDLKKKQGRDLFLELIAMSDVVIENFSARAMRGLDLSYERLSEANAGLIYLAMPAFGSEGPYRDYIGYGPAVEPMTGLPAVMGYSAAEPRITGTATPDAIAGVAAAAAVLTAIERRERTGQGAYVDVSHHEAGIALLGEYFLAYQESGHDPEYIGNGHPYFAPHGVYCCAGDDEWIAIAARDEAEWDALCEIAEQDWDADPRFATATMRLNRRTELDKAINSWTRKLDKTTLMWQLMDAGVPAGAVLKSSEYLANEHLHQRGYFARLHHHATGPQQYDGSPFLFNGTRGYDEWLPSPTLGEHNETVLTELLNMSSHEIARLFKEEVIANHPPLDDGDRS